MQFVVRNLGLQPYESIWRDMQQFTLDRTTDTADEIWVVEHYPVYTLGLNGKREHLLEITSIPVINSDRGGQITYHGPGQLIVYLLMDIKRKHIGIRQLVTTLEQSMISALAFYGISASAKANAPGVYVDEKKIGSIGLRIKNNSSYHGLSLNNNMDLSPFDHINTCGYSGLKVTQLVDLGIAIDNAQLAIPVIQSIQKAFQS
jgi:lipoyl(octanoyl) transferase